MLLRRITEHVKAQNWFAVSVDFVIVVVGVFIGIQVSNWNDVRQDRILEKQYLQRLYDDMDGSINDHVLNSGWDKERVDTQEVVLKALRAGVLEEGQEQNFARGLVYVGVHNPIRRRWGTVEELKSTGNIGLLRDLELRNQIAQTEASYQRLDRILSGREANLVALRSQLVRNVDPVSYGYQSGDDVVVNFDFDELIASEEFLNLFSNAHLESRSIYIFSEGYMNEIEQLRDRLGEILGIDAGPEND